MPNIRCLLGVPCLFRLVDDEALLTLAEVMQLLLVCNAKTFDMQD